LPRGGELVEAELTTPTYYSDDQGLPGRPSFASTRMLVATIGPENCAVGPGLSHRHGDSLIVITSTSSRHIKCDGLEMKLSVQEEKVVNVLAANIERR